MSQPHYSRTPDSAVKSRSSGHRNITTKHSGLGARVGRCYSVGCRHLHSLFKNNDITTSVSSRPVGWHAAESGDFRPGRGRYSTRPIPAGDPYVWPFSNIDSVIRSEPVPPSASPGKGLACGSEEPDGLPTEKTNEKPKHSIPNTREVRNHEYR